MGLARFGKGRPSLYTFTHPCKRSGRVILLAVSAAILFSAGAGSAWADNECGEGEQSGAITKITCDPGNYEPSEDGNIVYLLGHDDDHERRYTISIKNLSGERGITLNDDLDFPHAYNSFQPSAVWISYAGSSDLDVGISGIDLKTGFTEETATSTNNNDSLSGHGGINVWMVNDPVGTLPYATPRDLALNVRDSEIHTYSRAITGANFWDGAVNIDVRDSRIHTYGPLGIGIYGYHSAIGDIDIHVENVDFVIAENGAITGTVHDRFREDPDRYSGPATIRITVKNSRIKIAGRNSSGLYGSHYGSGEVVVALDHSSIEASDGADGIWVQHTTDTGQAENLNTFINVENSEIVTTDRNGIVIARSPVSTGTNMVAIGSSSSVRPGGDGDGVTTRGNTVVVIKGLVSAEDGKAIVNANGTLTLHIQDSGQIDGFVTNEAGHDFDIWVGNEQVVDNGEIIQRTGATGAFDTTVASSDAGVSLSREFGARAAVYEALANTLMRLGGQGKSVAAPVRSAKSPLWISAARARGSYEPERSTVGIEYDFSRYELEAGWDFETNSALNGSMSMRMVSDSSRVLAATGGGQIDVTGYGLAADLAWRGAGGVYAKGRLSLMWSDIDLASDARGTLKTGAHAFSHAIDLEGGQRLAVGQNTALTLRTWLSRSDLLMDEFTDAVGARVSVRNSEILKGGFGGVITIGPDRNAAEEGLSLRVSAGMEHTLSGRDSTVSVSGEELTSRGNDNRLLLGLGLTKRWRRSTLGADLRAAGPGSEDYEFAVNASLNIPF